MENKTCRLTALFYMGLFFISGMLFLHKPLPEGIGDRPKVQIYELFLRLLYLYPLNAIRFFGAEYQMMYSRFTLHNLARLFNPLTFYDPDIMISDTEFDGIPVRVYEPRVRKSDGAFLFIHGGGFVLFGVDSHDAPIRALARESGVLIVSIEYRLAPEHVFPAGLEDCVKAASHFFLKAASHYGVNPNRVIIGGDSAGGNLAAVTLQRLRSQEDIPPVKYIDLYTPSYQMYYKTYAGSALLDPESIAKSMLMYLGIDTAHVDQVTSNRHVSSEILAMAQEHLRHEDLPPHFIHEHYEEVSNRSYELSNSDLAKIQNFLLNPDFSPLMRDDFSDLPPTMVLTCEYDILRDEGYWYANKVKNAGVPVTYKHYEAGFHGMINFYRDIQVAKQSISDVAEFIRNVL